jgi:hypothetical protein
MVAERDGPGNTKVTLTDGTSEPVLAALQQWAWVADTIAAGNLVSATLSFQSQVAAYGTIGLAAFAFTWLDDRLAERIALDPKRMAIEFVDDENRRVIRTGASLDKVGPGRWQTVIPDPRKLARTVSIRDAERRILAEARVRGEGDAEPEKSSVKQAHLLPNLKAELRFESETGDDVLRGGRTGNVFVTVHNQGQGVAKGVKVSVLPEQEVADLHLTNVFEVGNLAPGKTVTVPCRLRGGKALPAGTLALNVLTEDLRGFDAPVLRLKLEMRPYEPVRLSVGQAAAENGAGDSVVRRGEQLTVSVLVHNPGPLEAKDVSAELVLGNQRLLAAGALRQELGDLPAGKSQVASFSMVVTNGYDGPATLPLKLRVEESRAEGNLEAPVTLALDEAAPRIREVVIAAKQLSNQADSATQELVSEVDKPVPEPRGEDQSAFALVIGVERYLQRVPPVPYARRDAHTVREYFQKALGVPPQNVLMLLDEGATKTNLDLVLRKLAARVDQGNSRVFVYLAGHGTTAGDVESQAFLVPYDGDPAFPMESCFPLTRLYQGLGALGAASVTVFQDTCFSGVASRADQPVTLVAEARPLAVAAREAPLPKNVAVLAATDARGYSNAFPAKRHGLYTYFLLDALRDPAARRKPLAQLQAQLKAVVSRQAALLDKEQSPTCRGDEEMLLRGLVP